MIKGTKFVTTQDPGHKYSLAVEIIVNKEKEQMLINKLKQMNNYVNVIRIIGKFDLHAIFHIKNLEDIKLIRSELSNIKGIQDIIFLASNQIFGYFPDNLF